jgi:hypothetical protein
MEQKVSLYEELIKNGIEIDNHESDLYFPMTLESIEILEKYPSEKRNARIFKNEINGEAWYDVPFAYIPWWEKKQKAEK